MKRQAFGRGDLIDALIADIREQTGIGADQPTSSPRRCRRITS